MDYKKAYTMLVVALSKAITEINKSRIISQEMLNGIEILKEGLNATEDMYIAES